MNKVTSALLCAALMLSLAYPALAAEPVSEMEIAAEYLYEQGIMVGDGNGDMRLNDSLNRAELAVLLTRLHGGSGTDPDSYAWACYFTDVPQWAAPYVGYCTAMLLVAGYGNQIYGANDPVTSAAACTVILRACGYDDGEGSLWDYNTACSYAASLGLLDPATKGKDAFTRGDMALLIYRTWNTPAVLPQVERVEGITTAPDGAVLSKTVKQKSWSREDFSQEASQEIFTGCYTRGWYNAIRQSIVDWRTILAGNNSAGIHPQYLYAHTAVADDPDEAAAFAHILGRIGGFTYYSLGAEPYVENQYEYPGYAIVKAATGAGHQAALSFITPELEEIANLDPRSRVIYWNHYLCGLMEYDASESASAHEIFSAHEAPVLGRCSSYAAAFAFLCGAADVPCVLVSSETHTWNEVYVDGHWQVVDVAANDAAGGPGQDNYLLKERVPGTDRCPQGTRFAKELLVPGSTQ